MAVDGGVCCKHVLYLFSGTLEVVGSAFLFFGEWLKENATDFHIDGQDAFIYSMFVIILIFQGSLMVTVGTGEIYSVWKQKRKCLKWFCALLAALALADFVIGVVLYFKFTEFGKMVVEIYATSYDLYQKGHRDLTVNAPLGLIHQFLPCCGVPGNQALCPTAVRSILPGCPGLLTDVFAILAPAVMGVFLGTAALLVFTLLCTTIYLRLTACSSALS